MIERLAVILMHALVVGATAAGLVFAVRTLAPIARMVERGIKPWSCDVCASFWATVLCALVYACLLWDIHLLLSAGPAYVISYGAVRTLSAPSGLPPPPMPPDPAE